MLVGWRTTPTCADWGEPADPARQRLHCVKPHAKRTPRPVFGCDAGPVDNACRQYIGHAEGSDREMAEQTPPITTLEPRQIEAVDEAIREVSASIVMPRFRNLSTDDVREKGPGDYVTIADLESELALTQKLVRIVPDTLVVGEEAATKDPAVVAQLERDEPVWVIDPIDGTANFATGYTPFAVMVALVHHKVTVAGWIYLPATGVMATAVLGGGASLDGEAQVIEPIDDPGSMHGIFHIPRSGVRRVRAEILGSLLRTHHRIRCAGADYVDLLMGRTQVALFNRMTPWDHAAGMLMHAEAGGVGRKLDGSRYIPVMQNDAVLLAPDVASWTKIRDKLPK